MQSELRDLGGGEVILMAAMILLMGGVSLLLRLERRGSAETSPGQRISSRAYLERQFGPARSALSASSEPVAVYRSFGGRGTASRAPESPVDDEPLVYPDEETLEVPPAALLYTPPAYPSAPPPPEPVGAGSRGKTCV